MKPPSSPCLAVQFRWLAVSVAAAAAVGAGVSAQQVTFKASSDLVAVYATVRDGYGNLVKGLTKDDFEVRENGKVREIVSFSNDVQPITLAMIVDRSGSLASRAGDVTAAATGFFDALRPGDRVALGSLTWDCVALTDDLARLRQVVAGPVPIDWGSPIWESIDRAFFAMENEPGRRAIIVFSDGQNTDLPLMNIPANPHSPCRPARTATGASSREVAARAERNGVMVYAVGVAVNGKRNDDDLRSLARNTGGELFRMNDGESLTPIFTRIAEELHSQYLLGFVPTVTDGKSARIEVRTKRRGLQVRSRRSFAVKPDEPMPAELVRAGPLTDAGVAAAIADGLAGRSIRASCTARGGAGTDGFFDVTLEGPIARIMRAARGARDGGQPFTVNDVPARMRADTVTVTATGRRPVPVDPQVTEASPPLALSVYLRVLGPRPTLLAPIASPPLRPKPGPIELDFELAAIRGRGTDIEVVVQSSPDARCRLSANAMAQVR